MNEDLSHRLRTLEVAASAPDGHVHVLAALGDAAPALREAAVGLAARYVDPKTLAKIVRDDEDAARRNSAISALERQGPYALPCLLELVDDADARIVMFATQILAQIGEAEATPHLLRLLAHDDLNVRQAAIEALGFLRAADAVQPLIVLLRDELWLQFAAVTALGEIADPRAVPALLGLLGDELLGSAAAEALGKVGDRSALRALLTQLVVGDELPGRDRLLLAAAAIVSRGRIPAAAFLPLRRAVSEEGSVTAYLTDLLEGESEDLGRAAVRLVLAARVRRLYPPVFGRVVTRNDVTWSRAECERHRTTLHAAGSMLLHAPDANVRQGFLTAFPFDEGAVSLLVMQLRDPREAVREAACGALGRVGSTRAAEALAECLLSGTPAEQRAATEALSTMRPIHLEPLRACLAPHATTAQQLAALAVVAATGNRAFASAVIALSASGQPAIRAAAVRALGHDPSKATIAHLLVALHDPALEVGDEALEALVRLEARSAVPHVVRLLADSRRQYHAIRALGRLRDPDATPALLQHFASASILERIEILVALGRIGGLEARSFLRVHLAEDEPDLRRVAAEGLARHAGDPDVDLFRTLALDSDWVIRNCAARGLARVSLALAEPTLLVLVRDVDGVVRRSARAALRRTDGTAREES